MFTEVEVIVFAILSFCIGVGFTITVSLVSEKKAMSSETHDDSIMNLEKRISPFIQIHESLTIDESSSVKNESVNRLKSKIESFKHRNRFYQS